MAKVRVIDDVSGLASTVKTGDGDGDRLMIQGRNKWPRNADTVFIKLGDFDKNGRERSGNSVFRMMDRKDFLTVIRNEFTPEELAGEA